MIADALSGDQVAYAASDVAYPRKSNMGLWLAVGGAAVMVLGVPHRGFADLAEDSE